MSTIIRATKPNVYLLLFALTGVWSRSVSADAAEITIAGWPTAAMATDRPPHDFGDDPVIGRQTCPPLTRLNVRKKASEGVVLRRAVEEFRSEKGSIWRLELRTGIFWWNGEAVTAHDVAQFINDNFDPLIKHTYRELFPIPARHVSVTDAQTVTIDWKGAPPFGPYVFNGIPIFRTAKNPGVTTYECAGNYRPQSLEPLVLVPSEGYGFSSRLPSLKFTKDFGNASLGFHFSSAPAPNAVAACSALWPSPYFTVIAWNLQDGRTANTAFRKLMSGLVPRREIVSSGVLAYSDVVSAPIQRAHPGFNSAVSDMPFDAQKVSTGLNAMGFTRKKSDLSRTDAKGQAVRLVLVNTGGDEGLVEKLISDSFSSVGVDLDFVDQSEAKHVDGYFAAIKTDDPRFDFMAPLHPKTPQVLGFWKVQDEAFQTKLQDHLLTLTKEAPDFSILASIHQYLAEEQIFTVVAHHRACIKAGNGIRVDAAKVANGDPDWFRDILF